MSKDKLDYRTVPKALTLAQKLLEAGEVTKAKEHLKETLGHLQRPKNSEDRRSYGRLWFFLGEAKERLGQRASAQEAFENALESDDGLRDAAHRVVEYKLDSPDAMNHDMVVHYIDYLATGRSKSVQYGALRRLQQILGIRLSDRRAEIPWRMEMLERLRLVKPDVKFLQLYLGRGHYLREDFELAVASLSSLGTQLGETSSVLNILGRCHEKLHHFDSAVSAYEGSLRHTPDQPGVHFRLGRIALKNAELS